MHIHRTLFLLSALLISGCGQHDPMHYQVVTAPDLAIYDGIYFESQDGMKTYNNIVLIPRLLQGPVPIVLPDGSSIDALNVNADTLRAHGVVLSLNDDDGKGSYRVISSKETPGLYAWVKSGRAMRIDLSALPLDPSPFAVKIRGHEVVVPIKRAALEALLGKPDEIKLDTFAPDN